MSNRTIDRWSRGARRQALVWATVLMTILSLGPLGLQVAAAQPQAPDQQQPQAAQQGQQYLEIHVAECPPGIAGTGQSLFDACHANGLDNVGVRITSTDTALGIDQSKTTERVGGAGPGIVNTGDIPAGEYQVTVDVPAQGNAFSIYCSVADGEDVVATTPDNAAQATITLSGTDVVCDWYVLPQAPAKIDIAMYACDEAALSGDGRAWEDLSAACTSPAQDVEVTLTSLATNAQTTTPVDAQGKVSFPDLAAGDYSLYSDAPADTTDEYLFCEYTGQPRYEKGFDDNGVTTFTGLQGEQIACDWYVVTVAGASSPTATATATATASPTESLTQAMPTATATAPLEPSTNLTAQDEALASIGVALRACPQGYDTAASGTDYATFQQNCTGPVSDVVMTLTDTQGGQSQLPTDSNGVAAFPNLAPDTYTLYSSIPLEAAREYVFCTTGDTTEQKELSDRGVATFTDLETEQITCDWYVVPEDLRGQENGGSLTVHLAACPTEYSGDRLFDDCHGNGIADQQFTLTGPAGEQTATTEIPQSPGPGITTFSELPAGDYTLAGGPPGDFGTVDLYCSDQATNQRIDASIESTIATFAVGENQDILCDWYYIPENASGITPTPSPTPTEAPRAEILVTLYECAATDAASGYAGASYDQLQQSCQTPVNDVTFTLGDVGAPPLSAATGVSGDGAVRFYDLVPADYTLSPSLPNTLTSAAVYCRIGDGDVYQKSLQNGATTFLDVESEQISCDWFAAPVRQQQPSGPSGSITVREYLCQKDRGEIQDWERECTPGSTGTSFTLTSSDGAITQQATPNDQGVLVFGQLPDGFYDLKQDSGVWCRAAAERVDSRSRVIVRDGGNTDVFIYECGQVNALPSTGSGSAVSTGAPGPLTASTVATMLLLLLAVPLFGAGVLHARRPVPQAVPVEDWSAPAPLRTERGTHWIRFR
jgi:hypothetical protein